MIVKIKYQIARLLKVVMPLKVLAWITKFQLWYRPEQLKYFPLLDGNADLIPLATAYPDERMENYRIRGTDFVIYPLSHETNKRYSIVEIRLEKCFDFKGHISFQEVARKISIEDILENYSEEQQKFFLFNLNYFR